MTKEERQRYDIICRKLRSKRATEADLKEYEALDKKYDAMMAARPKKKLGYYPECFAGNLHEI